MFGVIYLKIFFMNLLVFAIFGKYCIRHILCGHSKIVTIFLQYCLNISVLCGRVNTETIM